MFHPRPPRLLLCGLAAALAVGCKDEAVTRYQIDRHEAPVQRTLGAILPQGKESWFFKLQGPAHVVQKHEQDFEQLLRSVRPPKDEGQPPTWTLPKGWREVPTTNELIHTTIKLGPDQDAPEVTVSKAGGSVLDNVNRWRRQLGFMQPPFEERDRLTEEDLPKVTRELKTEAATLVVVSLTGPGRTAAPKPLLPDAQPKLTYEKPPGWTEKADPRGIRLASFQAGDGVDAYVTRFPGATGGLLANVNRWRGEIGLKDIREEDVGKDVRDIEVAGSPAQFVDLVGPRERTLAVIAPRGDWTWFIKMRGPKEQVEKQRAAFEEFLKSVRFDAGKGGSNG